jgi:hypothetical protein
MAKKVTKKEQPERVIVSVRGVRADLWQALTEHAREQGRVLWSLMDEMLSDYLKKHNVQAESSTD